VAALQTPQIIRDAEHPSWDFGGTNLPLCLAARRATGADGAILWRLSPDECLEARASVGASVTGVRLSRTATWSTLRAFEGGERSYRGGDMLADVAQAERLGVKAAALQPVLRGGRPDGVICAWWSSTGEPPLGRAALVLELLAGEAAGGDERPRPALARTGA
jgi:hypothetical protein